MRLLLDEHLDPAIAVELCARGYDVVAVALDLALRGRSDADLIDFAAARGLVIATYNARDFLRLVEERENASEPVSGIVAISVRSFPTGAHGQGRLLRALVATLEEHPSTMPLAKRVVWLAPDADEREGRDRR